MSAFLRSALEKGAAHAASNLSKVSRSPWTVEDLALSGPPDEALADLLASGPEEYHGSSLPMAGGALLVLFPRRSGMLVAHRFTSPHSEQVDLVPEPELQTLAEISSMVGNAIVGALADALGRPLKMSPPQPRVTSQRDHVIRTIKLFQEPDRPTHTALVRLRSAPLSLECRVVVLFDAAKIGLAA